jgi:hypothetical protein
MSTTTEQVQSYESLLAERDALKVQLAGAEYATTLLDGAVALAERYRAALVAIGPFLTDCICGAPNLCSKCAALRQRAAALTAPPPASDALSDPETAGWLGVHGADLAQENASLRAQVDRLTAGLPKVAEDIRERLARRLMLDCHDTLEGCEENDCDSDSCAFARGVWASFRKEDLSIFYRDLLTPPAAPKPEIVEAFTAPVDPNAPRFVLDWSTGQVTREDAPKPDAEAKCEKCQHQNHLGLCASCPCQHYTPPRRARLSGPRTALDGAAAVSNFFASPTPAAQEVPGRSDIRAIGNLLKAAERENDALRAELDKAKADLKAAKDARDNEEADRLNVIVERDDLNTRIDCEKDCGTCLRCVTVQRDEARKLIGRYHSDEVALRLTLEEVKAERDAIAEKVRERCVALVRAEDECGRNSGIGTVLESLAQRMECLDLTAEVKP